MPEWLTGRLSLLEVLPFILRTQEIFLCTVGNQVVVYNGRHLIFDRRALEELLVQPVYDNSSLPERYFCR
jgi:hypothetical protein